MQKTYYPACSDCECSDGWDGCMMPVRDRPYACPLYVQEDDEQNGFTLAELLIVVAIIGVLVAIAMPTFTKNLEAAREAADASNLRSAYSEAVADHLLSKDMKETVTISGNYPDYKKKGYFVGSGAMESGNIRLMQNRMKLQGMRWKLKTGQNMLSLKAKYESGRWQDVVDLMTTHCYA